jgi:hypothetical protein
MAVRATSAVARIPECDGYRVESRDGAVGVVEEAWLDADGLVAALAVRLAGGLRGLLLAEDVEAVLDDDREVLARRDARLLELAIPRLEAGAPDGHLAAHWETTGERIQAPPARRRSLRPRFGPAEREFPTPTGPLWTTILFLYAGIGVMIVLVIALAFLVAFAVTGHAT